MKTELENWNTAIEGNGRYLVSDIGNVKSLITGKVLKPCILKSGYPAVNLSFGSGMSQKTFTIHRMVANAFIPNPENKRTVNHKNGNRKDNKLENLEWATYSENIQHSYDFGIRPYPIRKKGIDSPYSKKVVQHFPDGTLKVWDSIADAGRFYSSVKGNILSACTGKRKRAAGCTWKYLNK